MMTTFLESFLSGIRPDDLSLMYSDALSFFWCCSSPDFLYRIQIYKRDHRVSISATRCENDFLVWGKFLTLQKLDDSSISIAEIDLKIKPPVHQSLREIPIQTPQFGTMVKYTCLSPVEELYDDTLGQFIGNIPKSECHWNGTW